MDGRESSFQRDSEVSFLIGWFKGCHGIVRMS